MPQSPLSISENRRSLAVAVVELLHLHPPLFNSGADINSNITTKMKDKENYLPILKEKGLDELCLAIQKDTSPLMTGKYESSTSFDSVVY